MIVAELKPLAEVMALVGPARKILVIGCDTCVAECAAGGRKETALLASALRLALAKEGREADVRESVLDRQCVKEFMPEAAEEMAKAEVAVSLGCGAGVQALARFFPKARIVPGLNTQFIGTTLDAGVWVEECSACGDCKLAFFGAVCPLTRCSKRLLNGPCGGSRGGKCEVSPDLDCAWILIHDRLSALGQLDNLRKFVAPNDWSTSHSGRPRVIIREDRRL